MALVRKIRKISKARPAVHAEVECECAIFEEKGARYLQLDTYGTKQRKRKDQISQSIQLTRESADELRRLLDQAFPPR